MEGGRLVVEEFWGGGVAAVEVEPLGEPTEGAGVPELVMLTALFRLEPRRPLNRELMTSTAKVPKGGKDVASSKCRGRLRHR